MSVVIISGHNRLARHHADIRKSYNCMAKVFTQMPGNFKNQIGRADLAVLFTSTVSHILANGTLQEAKKAA